MKPYSHTQIGYPLITVYSLMILIVGNLIRMSAFNLYAQAGLILLLLALVTFATLKVSVDDRRIRIQFGLGLIRKNFPIREIETTRVVKNPWFYLLGIRYTPRGWLYAVSGPSALELQMKSGKRYRIGTDDPAGFATAVEEALRDHALDTPSLSRTGPGLPHAP